MSDNNNHWRRAIVLGLVAAAAGGAAYMALRRKKQPDPPKRILVTQLWTYPVKSLGGVITSSQELDKCGFLYDREWIVLRALDNALLTQRECPKMKLVHAAVNRSNGVLELRAAERSDVLSIPLTPPTKVLEKDLVPISLRELPSRYVRESEAAAKWLTCVLGVECFLARTHADRNPSDRERFRPIVKTDDRIRSQEHSTLHIITEEGLEWAQKNAGDPTINVARFRPNIVVSGVPFPLEDDWAVFKIGNINCRMSKCCGRCTVVSINDQGERHPDQQPNKLLQAVHAKSIPIPDPDPPRGCFGIQCFHENNGKITVGDEVVVTETASSRGGEKIVPL